MLIYLNKKGFTLIEIIIVITISVIIFGLITSIYVIGQKAYLKTDTRAEIIQNGRVILDRMVREIRQTPDIITQIPIDNSNPSLLPSEIKFQDGHDTNQIRYIRYFLDGTDIKRQEIVYYFPSAPNYYVYSYDTDKDPPHDPPIEQIVEEKIIGEYVDDLEFWGNNLININLYLYKNGESSIINTAVYGRNM